MTSKMQNKLKQFLYKPAKNNPHKDYMVGKLKEAEKALNQTVGGMLKKRPPKKKDDKDKKDKKA